MRKKKIKKKMKNNKSYKNGYHLNSKYWQNYKKNIIILPSELYEIAIGCMLGDACMYKISKNSKIKFEQGYMHKEYLYHLFYKFKNYTFHDEPYIRYENKGIKKGMIKSYSFRTFTHPVFDPIWDLFIENNKKIIKLNLIKDHLTPIGLTYWCAFSAQLVAKRKRITFYEGEDDGSLQNDKKTLIIHTQSYTEKEVNILSFELNKKFELNSKVIIHKKKYWVIKIPNNNFEKILKLIKPYIHPSMNYKINVK